MLSLENYKIIIFKLVGRQSNVVADKIGFGIQLTSCLKLLESSLITLRFSTISKWWWKWYPSPRGCCENYVKNRSSTSHRTWHTAKTNNQLLLVLLFFTTQSGDYILISDGLQNLEWPTTPPLWGRTARLWPLSSTHFAEVHPDGYLTCVHLMAGGH